MARVNSVDNWFFIVYEFCLYTLPAAREGMDKTLLVHTQIYILLLSIPHSYIHTSSKEFRALIQF